MKKGILLLAVLLLAGLSVNALPAMSHTLLVGESSLVVFELNETVGVPIFVHPSRIGSGTIPSSNESNSVKIDSHSPYLGGWWYLSHLLYDSKKYNTQTKKWEQK